jgi:hypothetical protein
MIDGNHLAKFPGIAVPRSISLTWMNINQEPCTKDDKCQHARHKPTRETGLRVDITQNRMAENFTVEEEKFVFEVNMPLFELQYPISDLLKSYI